MQKNIISLFFMAYEVGSIHCINRAHNDESQVSDAISRMFSGSTVYTRKFVYLWELICLECTHEAPMTHQCNCTPLGLSFI